MSDERIYPPGVVPAAAVVLALVVVVGMVIGALLARGCGPEPVQMIPTPVPTATPAVSSAATSSAAATATGRFRVVIPIGALKPALDIAPQARRAGIPGQSILPSRSTSEPSQSLGKAALLEASNGADPGDVVIEFEQVLTSAATSSVQASASIDHFRDATEMVPGHGRLGVIAATMPGILAADLQLLRLDVSPLTRWLVDVDMEVGVDTIINLEAIGSGVTVGSKDFVGVYGWNRWNMSGQGVAVGVGLRF